MKRSFADTFEAARYPVSLWLSRPGNAPHVEQEPMGDLKFFALAFSAAFLTFFSFIA